MFVSKNLRIHRALLEIKCSEECGEVGNHIGKGFIARPF